MSLWLVIKVCRSRILKGHYLTVLNSFQSEMAQHLDSVQINVKNKASYTVRIIICPIPLIILNTVVLLYVHLYLLY